MCFVIILLSMPDDACCCSPAAYPAPCTPYPYLSPVGWGSHKPWLPGAENWSLSKLATLSWLVHHQGQVILGMALVALSGVAWHYANINKLGRIRETQTLSQVSISGLVIQLSVWGFSVVLRSANPLAVCGQIISASKLLGDQYTRESKVISDFKVKKIGGREPRIILVLQTNYLIPYKIMTISIENKSLSNCSKRSETLKKK